MGANVVGTCSTCGFRFDLLLGTACPNCYLIERIKRVTEAFAPLDPLRTALGLRKSLDNAMQGLEDLINTEDTSVDLRIPKDEPGQIYELRRLFRL